MQCGDLVGGRFEIGAVVREGGMGIVFRAHDRLKDERVAVKTLIDASPAYAERFAREASLLASLRHPAVVSYVAHGFTDAGEPYLVMEWLDGEDLVDRLVRGPLGEDESRELALRMAEALGAAHALGIVHRDVKPSNVVLVGNEVARATLIDFGVALAGAAPRRTRTGLIVGTPGYVAPEQARASRDVDARADVYALGCVLFECVTGKPPFSGDHPVAVLAKVLLDEPPSLRVAAPGVAVDLDLLVTRMLAKDPAARPSDGNAVADALRSSSSPPPSVRAARMSSAAPSVLPESITGDERVVVHVLLAARFGDGPDPLARTLATTDEQAFDADAFERRFDVRVDVLADGSALATIRPGALGPKGGAVRAANVARALAEATSSPVALASGLERLRRGVPLGEVVDRAVELARHAAHAGLAGVIVDELTADLVRDAFDVIAREGAHMLGDGTVGATAHAMRPIVGRDRELGLIASLFDEVTSESESRIAIVTAAPGGGKTRLVVEAIERVREADGPTPRLCFVRCDESTSRSPLSLASDIACAVCEIVRGQSPEEKRARLAAHLETSRLAPAAKQRVLDFVGDVVGATLVPSLALLAARTDAMIMSDQVQRAFVDLVGASCDGASFVLAVDDFQWCDRASFRLIEAVTRELESKPLLLLGLARPDFDTVFPAAFASRSSMRIPLASLGRRAAESLVREVIGGDADAEVVASIVARGEGNAFMLEELARGTRDGRTLDRLDGTTAVVASRFEALSAEGRRVLRAASIVGQRFSVSAVAALVGSTSDAAWLDTALVELDRAEVVSRSDDALAFRHGLLRDAAYATLTDDDKALGHKLAARFFDGPQGNAMIVATHAELGGELDLAARAYVDGARASLEATDLAGVAERVDAAIRCGGSGALLGHAERLRAEAAFWLGALRDSADYSARALELLDASEPDFFVAAGYLVAACSRLGQPDRALENTRRILTSPASPVTMGARTGALLIAAGFLPLQGQVDLAKAILRDAKPIVDALAATHPVLPARYFRSRALCAMASGDIDGYLAGARDAALRFAELGDVRNELAQRGNVIYAMLEVGDHAGAVREGRAVVAEAERLGLRNVIALAKQNTGYALVQDGAYDEGVAMLAEALAEFGAQGHARMEGGTQIYLANAYRAQHRNGDARRALDAALVLLATAPPLRAYALAVLSRVRLAEGDSAGAKTSAEEALAILDSLGGIDSGETDVYLATANARFATGDDAAARTILRRGRDRIRMRAARLDETHRATFLTGVSSNVELLALAARSLED